MKVNLEQNGKNQVLWENDGFRGVKVPSPHERRRPAVLSSHHLASSSMLHSHKKIKRLSFLHSPEDLCFTFRGGNGPAALLFQGSCGQQDQEQPSFA